MLDRLLAPYAAIQNLVDGGGPYVFLIFLSGVLMWTLVIERVWFFWKVLPVSIQKSIDQWNKRSDHLSWCARQIREAMISRLTSEMTTNLLVLRVLVPMAPLLGLIGTVSGMLEVFDSMALRGSADARTMAAGVSQAMLCTLSGLAVSITGLYPVYKFTDLVKRRSELVADQLRF
jgi:biopolymer transport protein ExbB